MLIFLVVLTGLLALILSFESVLCLVGLFVCLYIYYRLTNFQNNKIKSLSSFYLYGHDFKGSHFSSTLIASSAGLSGAFILIMYYGFLYGLWVFPFVWLFWILTQWASFWTIKKIVQANNKDGQNLFANQVVLNSFLGICFNSVKIRNIAGLFSTLSYVGLVICEILILKEIVQILIGSELTFINSSTLAWLITLLILFIINLKCSNSGFRGVVHSDRFAMYSISFMLLATLIFLVINYTDIFTAYGNDTFTNYNFSSINPDGLGVGNYFLFIISNIIFWGLWWPTAMDQWIRCAMTQSWHKSMDKIHGTIGILPTLYFGAISLIFVGLGSWLASQVTDRIPSVNLLAILFNKLFESHTLSFGTILGVVIFVGLANAAISTINTYTLTASYSYFIDFRATNLVSKILELANTTHEANLLQAARKTTQILGVIVIALSVGFSYLISDAYILIYASFAIMFCLLPLLLIALFDLGDKFSAKVVCIGTLFSLVLCLVGYVVIFYQISITIDPVSQQFYYLLTYWWPSITALFSCCVILCSYSRRVN